MNSLRIGRLLLNQNILSAACFTAGAGTLCKPYTGSTPSFRVMINGLGIVTISLQSLRCNPEHFVIMLPNLDALFFSPDMLLSFFGSFFPCIMYASTAFSRQSLIASSESKSPFSQKDCSRGVLLPVSGHMFE